MKPHVKIYSVLRGVAAMRKGHGKVNYGIHRTEWHGWGDSFWVDAWTPIWHDGRGPYITIGIGVFAFYRGY
jgi:hypothetical protein